MKLLNETDVQRLKVGDEVIYKETQGELASYHYRARVVAIYPYHIELSVAATNDPDDMYEDVGRYFMTSVSLYPQNSSYRLYKAS